MVQQPVLLKATHFMWSKGKHRQVPLPLQQLIRTVLTIAHRLSLAGHQDDEVDVEVDVDAHAQAEAGHSCSAEHETEPPQEDADRVAFASAAPQADVAAVCLPASDGAAGDDGAKLEGRWFGNPNPKRIVCAMLETGGEHVPGKWLAHDVFAAVWAPGDTAGTLHIWVGVFDCTTTDRSPRTAMITMAGFAAQPQNRSDILSSPDTAEQLLHHARGRAMYPEPWKCSSLAPVIAPLPLLPPEIWLAILALLPEYSPEDCLALT